MLEEFQTKYVRQHSEEDFGNRTLTLRAAILPTLILFPIMSLHVPALLFSLMISPEGSPLHGAGYSPEAIHLLQLCRTRLSFTILRVPTLQLSQRQTPTAAI